MTNQFLNNCMKLDLKTEFKNTFVIFDDIDSITDKKNSTSYIWFSI